MNIKQAEEDGLGVTMDCDAASGACALSDPTTQRRTGACPDPKGQIVRYVGDPMCSWCWGMAPALKILADRCIQLDIGFNVMVGGLRPGGGDTWNTEFRAFLRREWAHVQRVTGQPFGFSLLDRVTFDYDTEPACRAVVAMASLLTDRGSHDLRALAFFSSIQRRFYVDGEDPKQVEFYRDLCAPTGVAYEVFREEFLSRRSSIMTREQFEQSRHWGVRGFPSILLDENGAISLLASGYIGGDSLLRLLEARLGSHSSV